MGVATVNNHCLLRHWQLANESAGTSVEQLLEQVLAQHRSAIYSPSRTSVHPVTSHRSIVHEDRGSLCHSSGTTFWKLF